MITKEIIDQYLPTIGIECHVQLSTKTKLFSAVSNDAKNAEPNTLVSPICFGMPGVLPVLNEKAVELAVKAGTALNAEIAKFSKFDRKHYFYPDLPMGYQITQFDQPIVGKGYVEVDVDGNKTKVGVTRAHLEADAGKSIHPAGENYTLVDLNRAGTPLLEIVSEPDMHDSKTARAYCQELYFLMKYAKVSDVDLYHGNMRFDVNISVAKKDSNNLGTRAEIKNLNSFRAVERVVDYEIKRQIELIEKGEQIVQETRGWDDAKERTFTQRTKEDAHDYRYFPDSDLPPVTLTEEEIKNIQSTMSLLPNEIRSKLNEVNVDPEKVDVLLENPDYMNLVLEVIDDKKAARRIINWLTVDVPAITEESDNEINLTANNLRKLSDLVEDNKLSSTGAKDVLEVILFEDKDPELVASEKNIIQESDESAIEEIVNNVMASNPKAAEDVKSGEMKAIGFLVGQVMKESKGKANPKIAQETIKKLLDI